MTLLEITNRAEARHLIAQIDEASRVIAPNIMLYTSLKGIGGIIINICVLFFVTLAGWEVVDSSKKESVMKFVTEKNEIEKPVEPPSTDL